VQVFMMLLLLTVLALAAHADLLEHRIPNSLTALALAAGLLSQAFTAAHVGVLMGLAGAVTGLAGLLPFYLLRGMGAGDVKLMAAVGSFLGPLGALQAVAVTLVLGAMLGVAIIVGRRLAAARAPAEQFALELHTASIEPGSLRKQKFPYAVAIAGGTVLSLWHQGELASLATFLVEQSSK
jgi:prepilin peptidase CpaA